ncbi:MAG TPA: glycosyltransferase family A protein [Flavobacteriales bacterium]|nr:glycosyltransferase family A protein [Flavobacteriales bacterium]
MKIAVVIPCFNVEHHVEVAVRSVLDQTYEDLDVIAIDDGSTDSTREKLAALELAFPGRFTWEAHPRQGACLARNLGLARTQGEYVQFLDADDAILTDKLARQVDLVKANGKPDLVVGDFLNVFEDGTETTIKGLGSRPWMALIRTQLGTTSANLFKRSALEAIGGWRPEQISSQDYELMFRMLMNNATVGWDPHVSSLVLKRLSGSISRTGQRDNWVRYIELRRAMRDYLQKVDRIGRAEEIRAADQYLFNAIRVLAKHDAKRAFDLYDRTMPESFVPDPSPATTSTYIAYFKLLGFRMAERSALALGWFKGRTRTQ